MYEIYICNNVYNHLHYTWSCNNSSCIYKGQILIVGRVTRVYTKKNEYTHVSIFQIALCFI